MAENQPADSSASLNEDGSEVISAVHEISELPISSSADPLSSSSPAQSDNPLRSQLLALYDDLQTEITVAAPVCELSGRCCRFHEYGHTLFISRTESELLLEQGLPADSSIDEAGCPFQVNQLCTARERRPLGCHVYFCDPNYAGVGEKLTERYLRELKRLHDEAQVDWEYRRLHHFLREFNDSAGSAEVAGPEGR